MKSLKINFRLTFLSVLCFLVLCSINSVKVFKQSKVSDSTNSTNTTFITPLIDLNRKIKGNEPQFDKVSYVKQISAGGKAALELQASGE